ncbi:MAG: low molecular weight protein-tyrosine-phosphatase [Bacteroidia bacterium]
MNLLMVCIGNICRSPLAEGILKDKLQKSGLNYFVDSAGMINYHAGENPDYRSVEVGKQNGIDISKQIARQFGKKDFENFDLIFAMETSVYNELISLAASPEHKSKVYLFLDFAEWNVSFEVPDPYYGTRKDFEEVFHLIDKASDKIVKKFLKKTT